MALQDLISKTVRIITVAPIKTSEGVALAKEFGAELKEIEVHGIWVESPDLRLALIKESGMAEDHYKRGNLVFLPFSQVKAIIA